MDENYKRAKEAFQKAICAINEKQFKEAEQSLYLAKSLAGPRESIQQNLTLCLIANKDFDRAAEALIELKNLNPGNHTTALFQAQIEWERGNQSNALNWLEWLIENNLERSAAEKLTYGYLGSEFENKHAFFVADNYYREAVALSSKGGLEAAEQLLELAIKTYATRSIFHESLAKLNLRQGRHQDGLRHLRQASSHRSLTLDGSLTLALLEAPETSPKETLVKIDQLRAAYPKSFAPVETKVAYLRSLGCHQEALEVLEISRQDCDEPATQKRLRLQLLMDLSRHHEIIKNYEYDSAGKDPVVVEYTISALLELGRHLDAKRVAEGQLKIFPHNPGILAKMADVKKCSGDMGGAVLDYERSLSYNPHDPVVRNNYGLTLLCLKKFDDAWPNYGFRWKNPDFRSKHIGYRLEEWVPGRSNKVLIIWAEQGLGDEIFYTRFLMYARQRTEAKIFCLVDHRLILLLERSCSGVEFIRTLPENLVPRDYCQVSIVDLARLYWNDYRSYGAVHAAFLKPKSSLRGSVTHFDYSVGISWKSLAQVIGVYKSIKLDDFEFLSTLPIKIYSLQYGDVRQEIDEFNKNSTNKILEYERLDLQNDIDGLASKIAELDAVVTVSNVTAHLAGALGVRTYLLVPWARGRIWYWHHADHGVSDWYPTVKLYFQDVSGSWADAFAALTDDLNELRKRPSY